MDVDTGTFRAITDDLDAANSKIAMVAALLTGAVEVPRPPRLKAIDGGKSHSSATTGRHRKHLKVVP